MPQIPTEIRQMIFKEVLGGAKVVQYGFDEASDTSMVESIWALSATSHEARDEVKRWMSCTAFHFRNPEKLLDFFMRIPSSLRTFVRDIRIKAFPFPIYGSEDADFYMTCSLYHLLPLLPGLKLDRLTVYDAFHDRCSNNWVGDQGTYFCVEELIESNGWKEVGLSHK